MKDSYTVFTIQGYETIDTSGMMSDVVTIRLIDTSCENAMKRAKKLIKKKGYRVNEITEYTTKNEK